MLFLVWQYTGCVKKYAVKRGFTITNVQHAKKVVSDSPGLVDFAIGLENYNELWWKDLLLAKIFINIQFSA